MGAALLAGAIATAGARAEETTTLPRPGRCEPDLTREVLDRSLEIGTDYLLRSQHPEGNFTYLYDWKTGAIDDSDNQVRQAGALWGLAVIYHDAPDERVGAAVERGLGFFDRHARRTEDGRRLVAYPGEHRGATGAVALLALAHVDYLRAARGRIDDEAWRPRRQRLDELLDLLLALRDGGSWASGFHPATGDPLGAPNPYADGEALLALIKAAKYLGRDDLRGAIDVAVTAGYERWNRQARERDPDSRYTKGYYQWSSMAYFELATSGWPGTEVWASRAIELADWMIDVHRTLERTRNTGYAYEGIVPSYHLATLHGDREPAAKLFCTIEIGLAKLTSWQVGSPLANDFITSAWNGHERALGGVQNHCCEAPLRIDTTQHQMHSVILARRYAFPEERPSDGAESPTETDGEPGAQSEARNRDGVTIGSADGRLAARRP